MDANGEVGLAQVGSAVKPQWQTHRIWVDPFLIVHSCPRDRHDENVPIGTDRLFDSLRGSRIKATFASFLKACFDSSISHSIYTSFFNMQFEQIVRNQLQLYVQRTLASSLEQVDSFGLGIRKYSLENRRLRFCLEIYQQENKKHGYTCKAQKHIKNENPVFKTQRKHVHASKCT